MSSRDGLPRAIPSMWRALKRAYEAEPGLLVVAFSFSLLSALPDALLALWLKILIDAALRRTAPWRSPRRLASGPRRP